MARPTTNRFSPEVRGCAVRMVLEREGERPSRWAAMVSIGGKIGCSPHTLREWVQKADRDSGRSQGVPSDVAAKLKALERENRELRQANEILRKASAYFAMAELDCRFKSICKVLPIAPSTYHEHAAKRADPAKLSPRAKRDVSLKVEVRRVFAENFEVYGV